MCASVEEDGLAARQVYNERATTAAYMLLDSLRQMCTTTLPQQDGRDDEGSAALEAGDVAYGNVAVFIENTISGDAEEINEDGINATNPLFAVKLRPELERRRVDLLTMNSEEWFCAIGLILYRILFRGRTPPLSRQNAGNACVESGASEHMGADLSRHTTKRRVNNDSTIHGVPFDDDTPSSIRSLISDLFRPRHEVDNPFLSFEDVLLELKLISGWPDIFLRPFPPAPSQHLTYPEEAVGREAELGALLEVVARIPEGDESRNELVLVSGPSGSGKSLLVKSLSAPMTGWGYNVISLKFDRSSQQQPLAPITSAFNQFFATMVDQRRETDQDDANIEHIVTTLEDELGPSSIVVLNNMLPSLAGLFPHIIRRVISDQDLTSLDERQGHSRGDAFPDNVVQDDDCVDETLGLQHAANRRQHLFRRMIHAISSRENPLLIFMDDIQWADQQSLDLLSSMLLDFDHIEDLNGDDPQCFMVIGTYRDDQATPSHLLYPHLLQFFAAARNLLVTPISVGPILEESANRLISQALHLPVRVTRPLSSVIHRKCLGNPLSIKTFLNNLVETSVISYSLAEKRWIWDISTIQGIPMNDNVAQLMAERLLHLPVDVRESLKTMSCFGFKVCSGVLLKLVSAATLDQAVAMRIINLVNGEYSFAHDKIQEGSYNMMTEEEQSERHGTIGMALVSATGILNRNRLSSDDLVVIGQINRGRSQEYSADVRANIAGKSRRFWFHIDSWHFLTLAPALNLKASKTTIDHYDFLSAMAYAQEGLRFLEPDEDGWVNNYELCLGLNEIAAISCFGSAVPSNLEKMNAFLNPVFENAICVGDKMKCNFVSTRSLASAGKLDQATAICFKVLRELDEALPENADCITEEMIRGDISSAQAIVRELMHVLAAYPMLSPIYLKRYIKYLPLLSSRIITMSNQYGYCPASSYGLMSLAFFLTQGIGEFPVDIDGAIELSRMSMVIAQGLVLPRIELGSITNVRLLKEPLQELRGLEKRSLLGGEVDVACLSRFLYHRLCFFTGTPVTQMYQEIQSSMAMMIQLQQVNLNITLAALYQTISRLLGIDNCQGFVFECALPVKTEEELFQYAVQAERHAIVRVLSLTRFFAAFWLGQYDEAAQYASKSFRPKTMQVSDLYHAFYYAITAMILARRDATERQKWVDIAEISIRTFGTVSDHSSWNWENKRLLIEAENHHLNGDLDDAKQKYLLSIGSAKKHKFVHEEGLGKAL
ncbi:hypothetical protein THAOC_13687 [Thalassiosira oceanica]|uniref:Orc1-like AAA ATPase domain-containing protein n=1 Tax=Thalassiosira oceanica TaxID=159749 RepID=K0T4W0_THAOC|nr:hypothetical protein THAOC_13687 [Thalassiosira oceanica]|eukprot:EJK65447.1 hypothetical protein THAOC_13687 [Thalassiosira oceanica]